MILQTGLWFSDGKFPVNTNRPQRTDNEFLHVKYTQLIWVKIFFMGIIPAIFVAAAIVIMAAGYRITDANAAIYAMENQRKAQEGADK